MLEDGKYVVALISGAHKEIVNVEVQQHTGQMHSGQDRTFTFCGKVGVIEFYDSDKKCRQTTNLQFIATRVGELNCKETKCTE